MHDRVTASIAALGDIAIARAAKNINDHINDPFRKPQYFRGARVKPR